ncbi:Rap1a/Tai family immunity protein [Afifella sp. JA880]|uniref:Rap1a/Tai family immunity protein n=1 Tax=Afifella sp. JA880 TaxID=2975280 RepID=UPI0039647887
MHILRTLALAVALSISTPSNFVAAQQLNADFITGNKFVELCKIDSQHAEYFCKGYLTAVIQSVLRDMGRNTKGHISIICIPSGVDYFQLNDVVVKYIINYPEKRHFTVHNIASDALVTYYPCP